MIQTLPSPSFATLSSESTDEDLMLAVQDRQGTALEFLYRRHVSILRAVIFRAVHQDADADDVLQEVFIEIWNRADSFAPAKGRALGWMITLAPPPGDRSHPAQSGVPALQRNGRVGTRDDHGCAPAQSRRGGNEFRRNARSHRRNPKTLAGQPTPGHRTRVFRDLSQRQIAAETGIPVGTIKTRLQLALAKIERALKGVSREFVDRYSTTAVA